MTVKEKKIFLSLPSPERPGFIEEFWQMRDTDPDTEINEFKQEYFARIEEANRLFSERGKEGWLYDRGRIHILLGPPDQREAYPTGQTFYGPPLEIWYYGFFPIVFIDRYKDGHYRLEPLSARNISEINRAKEELKQKPRDERAAFDFDLNIKSIEENITLIQIVIPYRNLWLAGREDRLETELVLSLEIFGLNEKKVWEIQEAYPISVRKEELLELKGRDHIIENAVALAPGEYTLLMRLENTAEGRQASKKARFSIDGSRKLPQCTALGIPDYLENPK